MATKPSTCIVHTVPTKTDDNCSYASIWKQSCAEQECANEVKFDAFQHYSSDLLRLKTLLLIPDQHDEEDGLSSLAAVNNALISVGLSDAITSRISISPSKVKRRRGNSSQPIKDTQQEISSERKTRLSWELHPSLLLYDLFDEVGEFTQSSAVSDEEGNE